MPEECITCIFCDAVKSMCLVSSDFGITDGDKWSCSRCGSFTVVPPNSTPQKGQDIGNDHRDNRTS